jgi:hypothetical protein
VATHIMMRSFGTITNEKCLVHPSLLWIAARESCGRIHETIQDSSNVTHKYTRTMTCMSVIRAIALTAALVCYASATTTAAASIACHAVYSSDRTYAHGDWVSASFTAVRLVTCSPPGINNCPDSGMRTEEGEGSSEMYNYQCKSDDDTMLCSNDEYAPGSMLSEQVWVRDNSPCSSVSP